MSRNGGFTLVELLIYVAIFIIIAGVFAGIFVVTLRIQNQQTNLLELNNQLNFVMQTIQRMIRESDGIASPTPGTPASSLSLNRNGALTIISLGSCDQVENAVCVQEGTEQNLPITTSKISISDLSFSHFVAKSNHPDFPDSHTVQAKIILNANTANPQQAASRSIQFSAGLFK